MFLTRPSEGPHPTDGRRRLRIAQVAPPFEQVPPEAYGGTERVVAMLTEELARRGHDVTLFAAGDSQTAARLVPTVERAVWHQEPPYQDLSAEQTRATSWARRRRGCSRSAGRSRSGW